MPSPPARSALPAVGSALFFEGFEYHFAESRKPGHLTFARPDGADTPHRTVTVAADELARGSGAKLVPAVAAECADWMRRLTPDEAVRAMGHAREAEVALTKSGTPQFYHIAVEGKPVRLMAPPVARAELPVPKADAKIKLGGSSVTQTAKGR